MTRNILGVCSKEISPHIFVPHTGRAPFLEHTNMANKLSFQRNYGNRLPKMNINHDSFFSVYQFAVLKNGDFAAKYVVLSSSLHAFLCKGIYLLMLPKIQFTPSKQHGESTVPVVQSQKQSFKLNIVASFKMWAKDRSFQIKNYTLSPAPFCHTTFSMHWSSRGSWNRKETGKKLKLIIWGDPQKNNIARNVFDY